jgi:hypothetical protein
MRFGLSHAAIAYATTSLSLSSNSGYRGVAASRNSSSIDIKWRSATGTCANTAA